MSSLANDLKDYQREQSGWQPLAAQLLSQHEVGISPLDLIAPLIVAERVDDAAIRNVIKELAARLHQFLAGDRDQFQEGWSRLKTACVMAHVDLEEKYREADAVKETDVQALIKSSLKIKKYGSAAAFYWIGSWEKTWANLWRSFLGQAPLTFAELEVEKRTALISQLEQAPPSATGKFVCWDKGLPRSPGLDNLSSFLPTST